MRLIADLIPSATGVGYRFRDDDGYLGARVTTGITNPSGSRYIAEAAVRPAGATGVYWDCDQADVTADEDFAYRDAVEAFSRNRVSYASTRSVPFVNVLNWVATKMLGTPALMGQEEAEAYTTYINDWLRECWERADWPEWTPTQERFYRDAWDAAETYEEGDEVYFTDADGATEYYVALRSTIGDSPDTSTSDWETFTVETKTIALDQSGLTPIGTVLNLTPADPVSARNTPSLEWKPTPDGIQLLDSRAGNSVWVQFRERPVEFTVTAYDATEDAYAIGDLVYYEGETYACLVTSPAADSTPTENAAIWAKIDFPYVLARAVQQFAYAEALDNDGQHDKGLRVREQAEDALATEWSKAEGQQGQTRHFTVLSR